MHQLRLFAYQEALIVRTESERVLRRLRSIRRGFLYKRFMSLSNFGMYQMVIHVHRLTSN